MVCASLIAACALMTAHTAKAQSGCFWYSSYQCAYAAQEGPNSTSSCTFHIISGPNAGGPNNGTWTALCTQDTYSYPAVSVYAGAYGVPDVDVVYVCAFPARWLDYQGNPQDMTCGGPPYASLPSGPTQTTPRMTDYYNYNWCIGE